jgi:hypothetical protein
MDIVASFIGCPNYYHIDVNVTELLAQSHVKKAAKHEALEESEQKKLKQYNEWMKGEPKAEFVPFVVSSLGELAPSAMKFVRMLKHQSAWDVTMTEKVKVRARYLQAEIGRAVVIANAFSAFRINKEIASTSVSNAKQEMLDAMRSNLK